MLGPFVHRFKSSKKKLYVYDVNTNQIVQVDQVVFDIIEDFHALSNQDIISKWRVKHNQKKIKKALGALETFCKKGLFSCQRPRKMTSFSDGELKDIVKAKVGYLCFNITEQCNFRCRYCAYSGRYFYARKHTNRSLGKVVIKKALSFYSTHSRSREYRSIAFYGGEPLVAFDKITYAVNLFKEIDKGKYNIHIDTNGFLLNRKSIIDFVILNGCNLQISLDGPSSIHNKYRVDIKGRPTFDRIMKNLGLMKKTNESFFENNITFACTITPNYDLFKINDFFENNNLVCNHHLLVTSVAPQDTSFFDDYQQDANPNQKQQFTELSRRYMNARIDNRQPTVFERGIFEKGLLRVHRREINVPLDTIPPNGCCVPGSKKVFVATDGSFYPCERVNHAYNIGNVDNDVQIDKINRVVDNYIEFSEHKCLNCWGVRLCGICFANAEKMNKFDIKRKEENCKKALKKLHSDLERYCTIMEANPRAFDFVKKMIFVL